MTQSQMPKGSLIDSGVNLNSGQFRKDIDDVLARATDHGVMGLIAIASDVEESLALQQYDDVLAPMVWRTAGVHPHQAKTFNEQTLTQLKALLAQSRCVALGECGLDFNRNYSPPAMQTMAFESQVELACQSQVPLYLHERDAHDEVCQILRVGYQGDPIKGVIHCFTGDQNQLRNYLDLGLYIGITGWVCDERRGDALRAALEFIPLDRLLWETDAPYLRPRSYRGEIAGKRNEPALLGYIAKEIASRLKLSRDLLAEKVIMNTRTLFGLDC